MIRGLVRDKTTGQGDVDVHVVGGGEVVVPQLSRPVVRCGGRERKP